MTTQTKIRLITSPKNILSGLFLGFVFTLFGCQSTSPNKTEAAKLKNVTLNIKDLSGNPAVLVDGKYEEAHLFVQVLDTVVADFNYDGLPDGLLLIVENTGGTGSFYKLCLVFNNGIKMVQTDEFLVGDRIKVTNLDVDGNKLTLTYLDRKKNEPFSKKPHVKKTIQLKIVDSAFEEPPVG